MALAYQSGGAAATWPAALAIWPGRPYLLGQEIAMPDGSATSPSPLRFSVTPRAAAEIAAIAARQGRPGAGLRIEIRAGGCSGYQYDFGLEDAARPDDLVVQGTEARVYIDEVSLELVEGGALDWNEALIGAHFVVRNPQAASGCGCGASFALA
jgi:iron-sulfur cluster assembly accessory protein